MPRTSSAIGSSMSASFDEHGVDRRDRATGPRRSLPRAFEQAREHREHAWRIAAARRRLARGEADLALCAGEARDRVDEQHHALALVAEVLGIRGRDLRGAEALERGDVRRRDNNHAARAPRFAERVVEELADLRGRARRRARRRRHRRRSRARSRRGACSCRRPSRRTGRRAGLRRA